jgi:hypothetical protein
MEHRKVARPSSLVMLIDRDREEEQNQNQNRGCSGGRNRYNIW